MEIDFEQFIRDHELAQEDLQHQLGMLQQQNQELTEEIAAVKAVGTDREFFVNLMGKTNEEWAEVCERQRKTIRDMQQQIEHSPCTGGND